MSIHVRRIGPGEGARLRDARLAALLDAPGAFASTFEAESVVPAKEWEEAAARRADGTEETTFVAEVAGEWVGLVGAYRQDDRSDVVHLVSMWVAPGHRRAGVGRKLVEETVRWASATGANALELWVTHENEAAIGLYEELGFSPTADHQALPSDPCKDEVRMRMELTADGSGEAGA